MNRIVVAVVLGVVLVGAFPATVTAQAIKPAEFDVPIRVYDFNEDAAEGEDPVFWREGTIHYVVDEEFGAIRIHHSFELGDPPLTKAEGETYFPIFINEQCGGIVWSGGKVNDSYVITGYSGGVNSNGFDVPGTVPVLNSGNQEVRLELSQKFMLDGQSFRAKLGLQNNTGFTVENVSVDLRFFRDGADAGSDFLAATDSAPGASIGPNGIETGEWTLLPSISRRLWRGLLDLQPGLAEFVDQRVLVDTFQKAIAQGVVHVVKHPDDLAG